MERYKLEIVNDHGDRYIRCEPATDGSWVMFKDVAALEARIAKLEAALGRKGMSDIADKIYAATGLTLNSEAAAKIGQMIQQARRDALKEAWLVIADKSVPETPASFEDIIQRDDDALEGGEDE